MIGKISAPRIGLFHASREAWKIAIVFVAAAALSAAYLMRFGPDFVDITTLLMIGERVLNGETLYVEVRDINPPFSVWLYLPYAYLDRVTGIDAYIWLGIGLTVVLSTSLFALNTILREGLSLEAPLRRTTLWVIAGLCFFLIPTQFAQREHFCVIAALPFLGLIGARLQTGDQPKLLFALIIGSMAATLVILKPHYSIGLGLPLCWLAWERKDLRYLFVPEALAIAALVLIYGASIYLIHPEFFTTMLPIAVEVYLLNRAPIADLVPLVTLSVVLPILACVWIGTTRERPNPLVIVLYLATAGFTVAYFIMGKGWMYHLLPASISAFVALAIQAFSDPASASSASSLRRRLVMVGGLLAITVTLSLKDVRPNQIPEQVILLKSKPSIVFVSPDNNVSVPIAKRLQADWSERDPHDFVGAIAAAYANRSTDAHRTRLENYLSAELDNEASHMARIRPDLIVLDKGSRQWHDLVVRDDRIATILQDYQAIARQDDLTYLARKDLISGTD
ncbi:MAG: hypothetical protein AAGA89_05990 [Pseudomonadota bacterium]